jgi:adenosylmethionine-8-amino-7-oxononanoate aminotransferase
MAATLTSQSIFDCFLGEYSEFKTFFHGHSYTGNQIGAAVAQTSLRQLQSPKSLRQRSNLEKAMSSELEQLWSSPHVGDIRQVGLIAGIELVRNYKTREPFALTEQAGFRVCEVMAKNGVLTRPIGNVIVLMPPYCTTSEQLGRMVSALSFALAATFK